MMPSHSPHFWQTFYVLSGLTILGPVTFETFLPAIEDMANHLKTDTGSLLVSLAIMQLGTATGQIVYGPLSDRYGRRPIILSGMFIYILCSFLCITVDDTGPLYFLRLCQGLTVACTMIIFRAVVRDKFSTHEGARMFSYLYIVLALFPLIGPPTAGYLTQIFGWKSVFILMGSIGTLIFFILLFYFEESVRAKDRRAISPRVLTLCFLSMLSDKTFVSFLLCGVGAYGGLFCILAGLAPVMLGFMSQTPATFGIQFSLIMFFHFFAALFTGKLVRALGIKKLLFLATGISATGGLLMLIFPIFGITTHLSILGPASIFLMGFALTTAPMTAGAMSNFQHMAGRAASLLGFIQQSSGACITFLLSFLENGTPFPIVIILALCSTFSFVVLYFLVLPAPLKE